MERSGYSHHGMPLGSSVEDLGMNLDSDIGMVSSLNMHDAPFPTIAPPPPAPPQSHHHHHHNHHHHLASLPAPPQQAARHHHPHPHLHGGLSLPQHMHHRSSNGPSSQDLHGLDALNGKDSLDGVDGPRLVYKNPTNRYQLFVNAWVSNYELDKSFSERIKSAEAIWRTASGRFCTAKHRPSRPCAECMQAQQEVEQVLNASSGLTIKQTLTAEAVAAASRKRVANEQAANAAAKKMRSNSISAPSPVVVQEVVSSSGIALGCGGVETALILFGRRNSIFNIKFATDALLNIALDGNQGSALLSFIQLVNLYQHAFTCASAEFASAGITDKKLEFMEEAVHKLVATLMQAGYVYEDFIRICIGSQANPMITELKEKYKTLFESVQLRIYGLVKSMKSSFKSSVKKVVTLALSTEGSIFITGRNVQSWDHSNQYLVNFCGETSVSDGDAGVVLSYDQLVQASMVIRSFGIITLSRLMQIIGAPSLLKGTHPRTYDQAGVREVGHVLLDLFPIFIVRDSTREELHVIDQYRITHDSEKRNTFVGILLNGNPRHNTAIEQFLSELRTTGSNQDDSSKSFLDFPGNDLLPSDRAHGDANFFSVFCFIVNRFGSAFAKSGMNNDVCEIQQRWFDGELSISEVSVSCLQAKGQELLVPVTKLNIDSYHASSQIKLLQELAYHMIDEISVWSADDFPFALPCSGDVSAFSSTSVSFPEDDMQYVTVSGYMTVQPGENGSMALGDLKVFPKALSLQNSPSLGTDGQFHANEIRTILERHHQSGGVVKPVQIIFVGNGIGWSPQSQIVAFLMGRVWRDLGLHALVIANYAAGFAELNTIQDKIWGKMTSTFRSVLGAFSSVHATVNTVLTKMEDVWNGAEKLSGASLEHLEADNYWYQDAPLIQDFLASWSARRDDLEEDDINDPGYAELAEEWRFYVRHLDRRFNMLCFRRCDEGEICDHCQSMGQIAAPNMWKILKANEGKLFSPSWSYASIKQNYVYRSFIEEIESELHERPDGALPSRHGEVEKLICRAEDCQFLANSAVQLARHYEILHPDYLAGAPVTCRLADSSGKPCGLVFDNLASLDTHRKESNHYAKENRRRKKSLEQVM